MRLKRSELACGSIDFYLPYLLICAQAPRAKVEPFLLSIHHKGDRVYIWHPLPFGMSLGVTDIVAGLWSFFTKIALQCYVSLTIGQD